MLITKLNLSTGELAVEPLTDAEIAEIEAAKTSPETKAAIWEFIKIERERRKELGVKVGNVWFHTDDKSKLQHLANKDTARDQLAKGGTMSDALLDPVDNSPIFWKLLSGGVTPMTVQLAFDVVAHIKSNELSIHKTAERHKAAMESSDDPSSYDFSTGWPETFAGQL